MKIIPTLMLSAIFALASQSHAAALADLDASNTSYSFTSNQTFAAGGGFGDWYTGGDSFFPGGNRDNGFGTFSNSTSTNNGLRLNFAGSPPSLQSGQSIIVDFSHGNIAAGGAAAVELWNGGTGIGNGTSIFSFFFNGGDTNYGYFVQGVGDTTTSLPFTTSVQEVRIDIGNSNAFTLSVNGSNVGSGTLSNSVDNLQVVNRAANTAVIDNIQIVPEPTSLAMIGIAGCAAGLLALLKRRKRG